MPTTDPTTRVTEYGCTRCQAYHRKHLDDLYDEHMPYQAKHHYRTRPATPAERFALLMREEVTSESAARE